MDPLILPTCPYSPRHVLAHVSHSRLFSRSCLPFSHWLLVADKTTHTPLSSFFDSLIPISPITSHIVPKHQTKTLSFSLTMIQTLNPYATAKTAEIMSRYRPIAPRPDSSAGDSSTPPPPETSVGSCSIKIRQSPYLRNVWPQLQARPTRARKRAGRSTAPPIKRHKTEFLSPSPAPCHVGFVGFSNAQRRESGPNNKLVTLPLMPSSSSDLGGEDLMIDLNRAANVPEEKDLLRQLQSPVISPQPVRPVGSTIVVRRISECVSAETRRKRRRSEEVEVDVEAEILPAVISDSNNKVRMANSAYKELVGQPECSWLDAVGASKRIGGEVVLRLGDGESNRILAAAEGFSCWASIEWGKGKRSVDAFCDVIRLGCDDSKDYVFSWRFHTQATSK